MESLRGLYVSLFAMTVSLEECVIHLSTVPTRCEFCDCHLCDVRTGEINPTLILFSTEDCFHLRGYVDAAENLFLGHKAPVRDVTVCVLCCECNHDYWAHFLLFYEITNRRSYMQSILFHC